MAYSTTTPTYGTSYPVFAGLPRLGSIQLVNGSGTSAVSASNFTPASTGTRVNQIRCHSGPTTNPNAVKVDVLVNDGSNDRILTVFTVTATTDTLQLDERFDNLLLPSGYSLKAVARTTLTSGSSLDFVIMGFDLQV